MTETLFPPFMGSMQNRALNLLVNGNPITFGIRAFFLTQPEVAAVWGRAADAGIESQALPGNLFNPNRIPEEPLIVGDRVSSTHRQWPGSVNFGGYILGLDGEWAYVQWDFIPVGPITYDPLVWLEPGEVS